MWIPTIEEGHNYRWQYARSAAQLREMEQSARRSGRKINGYTADELGNRAMNFERFAAYSDAELAKHFQRIRQRCAARVAGQPLPRV